MLYALSATNLTILVALVFVLARNIVKLLVEKRRALPFAHFRAKLVAVLLGMTLIPAVLVLLVGSELIRNSVDRWFNAPMDDVLSSANAIAGDYYQERQRLVSAEAERLARALGELDLSSATRDRGAGHRRTGRAAASAWVSSKSTGWSRPEMRPSRCSSRSSTSGWPRCRAIASSASSEQLVARAAGGQRLDAGRRASSRRRRPDSQRRRRPVVRGRAAAGRRRSPANT